MGKVRKYRQKYHLCLKKSKSSNNIPQVEEQKEGSVPMNNALMTSKENIFSGIDISWDDLNKSLPEDFDVRSVVSTKSRKELKEEERHLKKKEKKKLRHERFMKKLDVTKQLMKSSKTKKNNKKNKKKNLETDWSSLLNALPSLQSLQTDISKDKCDKIKTKRKGILKAKLRLKQQVLDARVFKNILDDKTFKENPFQAISQYLKQKIVMDS